MANALLVGMKDPGPRVWSDGDSEEEIARRVAGGVAELRGMIAAAEARGDWSAACLLLGDRERLPWFLSRADAIHAAGCYPALLLDVWRMMSSPWIARADPRVLVAAFDRVGFVTDVPGLHRPASVQVWRGVYGQHGPGRLGLSWTTDLEVARQFARALAGRYACVKGGRVYRATATRVLAVIHGREESEVVVDPVGLRGVRLVERIAGRVAETANGGSDA